MKTVKCVKDTPYLTKGKTYQVKNYDYGMYTVKGDNGKYVVLPMSHFA